MSTLRQIFSNTAVQIAGKVITGLLGIITIKLLTGYFDKATFGDYTIVFEFLAFFGILADMGLFTIAVREMSKPHANEEKILGNILGIRISLAFLALGLATAIAFLMPKYDLNVEIGVLISALSMVAAFAAGSSSTILQSHMQMRWQALGLVFGKIFTVAMTVLGIMFMQHFLYFMVAGLAGNIIYLICVLIFVTRIVKINLRFDFAYWKELIKTALPYGLALILGTIYFRIDTIMLYEIKGSEATAVYGVAVKALEILAVVPVFFLNSTLPVMTRYLAEKSDQLKRLIQLAFDFLSVSGLAIASGMIVLATPIVLFIAQKEYIDSAMPLRILMIAMIASFLNSLFAYILVVANKQAKLLWINLACVVINIAVNLYVIPRWSYIGAAYTSILSEVFILIATSLTVLPMLRLRISLIPFAKMLLSAIVMTGVLYILPREKAFDLLLAVPIGAIVYFFMLWILRALDRTAVVEVLKMKR
ncbi:MAG: flippase [Patescibacteria group bacterium]|nr:flippase [Patescibacteria group bacterium]